MLLVDVADRAVVTEDELLLSDGVPEVDDVLAWKSTSNFRRASLMLEPLLPVEFTALAGLLPDVLDEERSGIGEYDDALVLGALVELLPVALL